MSQRLLHDLHVFAIRLQTGGIAVSERMPANGLVNAAAFRRWANVPLQEVLGPVGLLLDPDTRASLGCGLLRYLGWTVMARYLSRVVDAFGKWRDEERWLHAYCLTSGSLPAMAQVAGIDPPRLRFLSCGCCGTRWRYRRTGCPFCQNEDDARLGILVVKKERDLRIDYCESCRGYIKTYNGCGSESVLLADWTSLHLDIIAEDHGLNRLADSLYEV